MSKVKALVWSEFTEPKDVYPKGIHGDIAEYLNSQGDVEARTAQIDDPEQGVSEAALEWADVLLWWGHKKHRDVTDENVQRYLWRADEAAANWYFVSKRDNASSNVLRIDLGGTNITSITEATYSPYWQVGQRNVLVVAGTSGNTSAWLNGNLILNGNATAWSPTNPIQLIVGDAGGGASVFDGTISSLKIFHCLLTADEAKGYY